MDVLLGLGCNALQCSREPLEYRGKELEQDTVQCSRAERKAALQQRVDAVLQQTAERRKGQVGRSTSAQGLLLIET